MGREERELLGVEERGVKVARFEGREWSLLLYEV